VSTHSSLDEWHQENTQGWRDVHDAGEITEKEYKRLTHDLNEAYEFLDGIMAATRSLEAKDDDLYNWFMRTCQVLWRARDARQITEQECERSSAIAEQVYQLVTDLLHQG
jgi:hypothetical protein